MKHLRRVVTDALTAHPSNLLEDLSRCPGAVDVPPSRGNGLDSAVYLPGSLPPDKRVLLVAHVDTVASKEPTLAGLDVRGNMIQRWGSDCLGADDRAGVAVTWLLRKSGHSVLWTDGEECGGLGAHRASYYLNEQLRAHAYMVEIDRYGDECMAFYDGCNHPDWQEWLEGQLPGWLQERGSYTDIATLGPALGLCGVNLAAGYMYQHSSREILYLDALNRTYHALQRLLHSVPEKHIHPRPVKHRKFGFTKDDVWGDEWSDEDRLFFGDPPIVEYDEDEDELYEEWLKLRAEEYDNPDDEGVDLTPLYDDDPYYEEDEDELDGFKWNAAGDRIPL